MATPDKILADFAEAQQKLGKTGPRAPVVTRKGALAEAFANANLFPQTKKTPDPGGWKGFVQDVMGSPVGKVLTGAGEVLALPGRAVTSSLQELIDVLDTDPNTAASWDDFKTQVKDPTFGFGQIVGDITGNKWVNRAIGFVGDVALDPLTYVTLGTSKFAGSGGRFALANMAKNTIADIDPAKLAKVVRYGRSALDAEDIARLGINRTGLYMFGKRIAGTGKVGEVTEDILSKARVWTSDTRLGRAMQKAFTPKDMRDLRLMLMRGEIPDSKVANTLTTVISRDTQRAMQAKSLVEGQRRVVLASSEGPEFETVRGSMYKLLENDALAASAPEVMQRAHGKWRQTLNSFWDDIQSIYRTIQGAEDSMIGYRENYVPWVETDAARQWRVSNRSEYGRKAAEYAENPFAPVGVYNPRTLKEGSEWFGSVLTKEDLNIDRLNELANLGGFKGQYFETDLGNIMNKYISDYAEQMGIAARYKELNDAGVMKQFSESAIDEVVVDPAAVRRQQAPVAALEKDLKQAKFGVADAAQNALEVTVGERATAAGQLADVLRNVDEASKSASDASVRLGNLNDALSSAESRLESFKESFRGILGGQVPASAQPVVDEIDRVRTLLGSMREDAAKAMDEEEAFRLEYEAAKAEKAANKADVIARRDAARAKRAETLRLKKEEYDAGIDAVNDIVNYNMVIHDNWDLIVRGEPIVGPNADRLNEVASWVGRQPLTAQRRGDAGARLGLVGSLQNFVKQKVEGFEWYKQLNSKVKVVKTKIATGTDSRYRGTVAGLLDSGSNYIDDARADGMWALARDHRVYDGESPSLLVGAGDELKSALRAAEDSVAAREAKATAKTSQRSMDMERKAYDELMANVPEIQAAGARLERFNTVSDSIESRGLAQSSEVVSQEDQQLFLQAIVNDQQDVLVDLAEKKGAGIPEGSVDGGLNAEGFSVQRRKTIVESEKEASDYLGKLKKINERPVRTYRELYDRLEEIKKLVASRKWTSGQGTSARTFTAEDALVRANSTTGKSRLQTTLDEAQRVFEVRQTITDTIDPEAVAFTLADKMTQYYVLSELNQRFLYLTGTLSAYGAVPSREMFVELAANVAKPYVDMWEARVANLAAINSPQLEEARSVLARLKSFSENPSDDLYSVVLGDSAQRMKNAAPVKPSRSTRPLSQKSRTALDATTDKMQSAKADPRYLKAMNDKEIVDALEDLSGTDLHLHTLGDGTQGFLARDAQGGYDILTLPDGRPLSFTEAEWESLFTPPGASNAGSKAALAKLEKEIDGATAKLQKLRKDAEFLSNKRNAGKATSAEVAQLNTTLRRINAAEKVVADLTEQAKPIRLMIDVEDPAIKAAALEKARVLVHGNGTQRGWYEKGVPLDNIRSTNATRVSARRKNLHDAWKATPESKIDADIASAAAEANLAAQREMLKNPEVVSAQADRLLNEANNAAGRVVSESAANAPDEALSIAGKVDASLRNYRAARASRAGVSREVSKLERQLVALEKSLTSKIDKELMKTGRAIGKEADDISNIRAAVNEAEAAFNTAQTFYMSQKAIADDIVPGLQAKIDLIDGLLNGTLNLPQSRVRGMFGPKPVQVAAPEDLVKKAPGRAKARAAATKARPYVPKLNAEESAALIRWSRSAKRALQFFSNDPNDPIARALLAEAQAESRFLLADVTYKQELNVLNQLKKGDAIQKIVREVDQGWTNLEKVNLPRMQMPKDLADAMTNLRRVDQPEVARQLNRFLGKYTQYFKAYATLSPGFHVRNAIGNTIMVFAAGASPKNMARGLEIYTSLRRAIKAQVPFETWLEQIAKNLPANEVERIRIAIRASEAAGGGRIEEAFADFFKQGQKLSDNIATRASRRVGETVEGSGRFMLAYDSAARGLDFNASTARVRRYLFDYNDVGAADMAIRQVVPFWMWMSRNLPLQIVNQWTEPRTYAIYNQFMKNFGEDDEGEIVPKWLKQQGAVKIADNWYLSFDTGMGRVKEQFELLENPTRFLKDVNPILRVPFEVGMLNKKLYRGVPFSDKPVEVAGGLFSPAVMAFAKLLGQTEQLPDGSTGVTDKFNYAVMNLNPLAGTAERLIPSSEFYSERQLGSIASFLGLPLRQVTDAAREAELRRRKYEGE